MDNERQELHCHNCNQYVQFDVDMSMDGNLVLECPVCGHEHCRIVKDGIITEGRWDRRNGNSLQNLSAMNITYSTVSTYTSYMSVSSATSTNVFSYQSWMNISSAC